MDPLSDVLSHLNVSSALSSRFEARGKWAFGFGAYQSQIKFCGVLQGRFRLKVEGLKGELLLQPGDIYLLTNGHRFSVASEERPAVVHDIASYLAHRDADGVVRFGKGEPLVVLTSGRFTFDSEVSELLLGQLPPLIHLPAARHGSQALAALLALLAEETTGDEAGGAVAKASLATLMLVHAMREFLRATPQPAGWLSALSDPRIGVALAGMHGDLANRWTVESLGQRAGMSRTAFANRFRELAGVAPLEYLTNWRMTVAQRALRVSDEALVQIAERVGYTSDTAFSAAFKKSTGSSPGRYRQQARAAPT